MEASGARTNLIILDACRNNPFPGVGRGMERGLAVVGSVQPPRSLIVYSTAPGKTAQDGDGRNGVFTGALLKHLADPGLDAELMIRRVREDVIASTSGVQVPRHNSSVTGQGFFFAGRGEVAITTDPSGAEISVNGVRKGLSPLSLDDVPRYVEVEITATMGDRSASRKVILRDASRMDLALKLQAEPGNLLISANESDSSALLDGTPVKATASGTLTGLEAGKHVLELRGAPAAYRGEVTVVGGKTTPVTVTMVPFGTLVPNLPVMCVCRIEGNGVLDTSSTKDYGRLPVGQYKLTVTGGDYEAYTETVTIKRAETLQFVPRLRFTALHLTTKYRTELDDLDINQVGAFQQRVQSEGRPELQGLLDEAGKLKGRLVMLKARQDALAVASGSASMQGPRDVYDAYSAEYAQLSELEKAATLTDANVEKVNSFTLEALAQPFDDFQQLAVEARGLSDRLLTRKASLEQKASLDSLVVQRDAKRDEYTKAVKSAAGLKNAARWGYWIGVGAATLSVVPAVTGYVVALNPAYANAATMSDATDRGQWLTCGDAAVSSCLFAGILSALTGPVLEVSAPNTRQLDDAIRQLDEKIAALAGTQ
jgi:hypothetical protein